MGSLQEAMGGVLNTNRGEDVCCKRFSCRGSGSGTRSRDAMTSCRAVFPVSPPKSCRGYGRLATWESCGHCSLILSGRRHGWNRRCRVQGLAIG